MCANEKKKQKKNMCRRERKGHKRNMSVVIDLTATAIPVVGSRDYEPDDLFVLDMRERRSWPNDPSSLNKGQTYSGPNEDAKTKNENRGERKRETGGCFTCPTLGL